MANEPKPEEGQKPSGQTDGDNKKAAEAENLDDINLDNKTFQDVEKDPRISFGPPKIQTPEDAREAYLREEVSLSELSAIAGKFSLGGQVTFAPPSRIEKGDEAFHRDLPAFMKEVPNVGLSSVDENLEAVRHKEEVRKAAEEAANKVRQEAKPQVDLREVQNKAAEEAASKKEEQLSK